jgi:integrase
MAMIETRTNAEGNTSFRVKVRVRGFPTQTATFARKTDAKEWGKQTEIAIKEGKYFKTAEAKKHTFKELVDRYLSYVEQRNPRRHPWVKQYLAWWTEHLGDYALSEIGKTLIIEKRDKLLTGEKKRTNATVNRYMTALSHAFTIAINEWEWVQDHPMKKISKLPEPRGRIRFLDDDERQCLLEACQDNESLYLLVVLALSTGARHGELINLRWKDIDLKRQVITLHDTKNKERRVLPLAHHALELIKKHQAARDKATDLLFPAPRNPQEVWSSRAAWDDAVEKAELNDFRFHDLRHSAASYLAMNGASLAEIAEVLGHKTLAMVKRYAHLSEAHTASVVEKMNRTIFK